MENPTKNEGGEQGLDFVGGVRRVWRNRHWALPVSIPAVAIGTTMKIVGRAMFTGLYGATPLEMIQHYYANDIDRGKYNRTGKASLSLKEAKGDAASQGETSGAGGLQQR